MYEAWKGGSGIRISYYCHVCHAAEVMCVCVCLYLLFLVNYLKGKCCVFRFLLLSDQPSLTLHSDKKAQNVQCHVHLLLCWVITTILCLVCKLRLTIILGVGDICFCL